MAALPNFCTDLEVGHVLSSLFIFSSSSALIVCLFSEQTLARIILLAAKLWQSLFGQSLFVLQN